MSTSEKLENLHTLLCMAIQSDMTQVKDIHIRAAIAEVNLLIDNEEVTKPFTHLPETV